MTCDGHLCTWLDVFDPITKNVEHTSEERARLLCWGRGLPTHDLRDGSIHLVTLAVVQQSLPLHKLGSTLNEHVHQIHLTLADAVSVGDVPGAASVGRVDTTSATSLETHFAKEGLPVRARRELGQHHHGASTQTSSEVRRAREHPTEVVVVHEASPLSLEHLLHLLTGTHETSSHFLDQLALRSGTIAAPLHRDNAEVVLLTDPHKEVLALVLKHTAAIGPVTTHARRQKQSGVRLLEEVTA